MKAQSLEKWCHLEWCEKNLLISQFPDIILLNCVNSLLNLIQTVPTWTCCIRCVNSPSSSLILHPSHWQARTLSEIQMDRRTHHYSVRFPCRTTTMSHTHIQREIYAHPWALQLVEKQHGQCSHPAIWQGLSGHFTKARTCECALHAPTHIYIITAGEMDYCKAARERDKFEKKKNYKGDASHSSYTK